MQCLIGDIKLSKIAVAVSGGSDSVALLMLTSAWVKDNDITLTVMSVDHHLREASKIENDYVRSLSTELGHEHFQLHFDHQNNFANLQARAREARYKLMTDLCKQLDILTLLTAHHLDDYLENFCIRQMRKSGVFGLSSSNIHWYNNTNIIRPLYNIAKQELVDYLTVNNIKWFEDESNTLDKYQRNIIRKRLATTTTDIKTSLISNQLKINHIVNEDLNAKFIEVLAQSVKIYEFGFARVDLVKVSKVSNSIKLQLISYLLFVISGDNKNIRAASVMPILTLFKQGADFIKTLHGCILKKTGANLLVYREFGRTFPSKVVLTGDTIWDSRFRFRPLMSFLRKWESRQQLSQSQGDMLDPHRSSDDIGAGETYYITHLTQKDYAIIKKHLDLEELKNISLSNHIAILFTLPVIKILEKVIAMPHISYYDKETHKKKYNISFYPSFTSRFTHFC